MTGLDQLEREVLSKAQGAALPPVGSKELGWTRLTERLAAAPSLSESSTLVTDGVGARLVRALGSRTGVAVVAATLAGALGFGAGYWARGQQEAAEWDNRALTQPTSPATPVIRTSQGTQQERNSSQELAKERETRAQSGSAGAGSRSPITRRDGSQDEERPTLGDEVRLLRRVDNALRSQNPMVAIGLLVELDRQFPNGQLVEERRAARVAANCQLVDDDQAREAGKRFLVAHPGNAYAERVRHACKLKSGNGP